MFPGLHIVSPRRELKDRPTKPACVRADFSSEKSGCPALASAFITLCEYGITTFWARTILLWLFVLPFGLLVCYFSSNVSRCWSRLSSWSTENLQSPRLLPGEPDRRHLLCASPLPDCLGANLIPLRRIAKIAGCARRKKQDYERLCYSAVKSARRTPRAENRRARTFPEKL
jgi:hypothetical protein